MDCSPPGSSRAWDSPGKNTGVGCHFLLQGIFPTQGSNPGLPHCRQTLKPLSHQGSPLSPRVCSNSCLLSWWHYLTISWSAVPFSFCHQSFPASASFPMSQFFPQVAKVLELQLHWLLFLALHSEKYFKMRWDLSWDCKNLLYFVVVQLLSHLTLFQPHGLQYARPPCPLLSLFARWENRKWPFKMNK